MNTVQLLENKKDLNTCVRAYFDLFFLSYQLMATSRGNSSGDKSVIMEKDEEINIQSNRTTTHIKSRVFIPKYNECVLIGNKSLI